MKSQDREDKLLPGGVPRYVRCYDEEESTDRYIVVFTGAFDREGGGNPHLTLSASPLSPGGTYKHGTSIGLLDAGSYAHLGKPVKFEELTEPCKGLIIAFYRKLWKLEVETVQL